MQPAANQVSERDAGARERRARRRYLAFAALFCMVGLLYSLGLGEAFRYPDERDYIALARHLAAFDGYTFDGTTPTAHRPPGYPLALAPLIALTDSVHAVRVSQFALLTLAAWLLARLVDARAGFGRWQRASLVLALVIAYPVLPYTAGTLFPQTLIALVATVVVVLLQRRDDSRAVAALVGALAAFAAEISPTALTLVPLALLFAATSPRWSLSRAAIMALAASLVFGAWLARNLVVLDAPILFSTNLAENLDNAVLNLEPLAPTAARAPASTLAYGLERIGQYAASPGIYVRGVLDFLAWRNVMHVAAESSPARELIMFVTYHALLLAVLARLALARRAPLSSAERLVLALYLATALFHALVIPRIRYRLPFDFLLLLPAANALLIALAFRRTSGPSAAHVNAETEVPP